MGNTSEKRVGELTFALFLLLTSLLLVVQLPEQVKYFSNRVFYKQPGLWTLISLVGMVCFGALYCVNLWRKHQATTENKPVQRPNELRAEVTLWLCSVEYLVWFMGYVLITPIIGYLFASALFAALLTMRLGYRSPRMVLISVLTAISIVLIFKTFLSVKIPGGSVYEYLPQALRNFMIIHF